MNNTDLTKHLALSAWRLSEDDKRLKAGRLCHAGWHGVYLCTMSPYEEKMVRNFIKTIPTKDVYFRAETCHENDLADVGIGNHAYRAMSIWLESIDHFEQLKELLQTNRDRTVCFSLGTRITQEYLQTNLSHINHLVVEGENALVISIEDCPAAVGVKLVFG